MQIFLSLKLVKSFSIFFHWRYYKKNEKLLAHFMNLCLTGRRKELKKQPKKKKWLKHPLDKVEFYYLVRLLSRRVPKGNVETKIKKLDCFCFDVERIPSKQVVGKQLSHTFF